MGCCAGSVSGINLLGVGTDGPHHEGDNLERVYLLGLSQHLEATKLRDAEVEDYEIGCFRASEPADFLYVLKGLGSIIYPCDLPRKWLLERLKRRYGVWLLVLNDQDREILQGRVSFCTVHAVTLPSIE